MVSVPSLHRTQQALADAPDLAAVMLITRRAARWLAHADGATFVLRDGKHCFYADEDAIGPLWKGRRFPLESCISGWAMTHGEAVAIHDIYRDARIPLDLYRPTFVHSLAMMPVGEKPARAAIGIYWSHQHTATPVEMNLLQVLAHHTADALVRCSAESSA